MTTAPNGELRRQDFHLQVQQLVSLRSLPQVHIRIRSRGLLRNMGWTGISHMLGHGKKGEVHARGLGWSTLTATTRPKKKAPTDLLRSPERVPGRLTAGGE